MVQKAAVAARAVARVLVEGHLVIQVLEATGQVQRAMYQEAAGATPRQEVNRKRRQEKGANSGPFFMFY